MPVHWRDNSCYTSTFLVVVVAKNEKKNVGRFNPRFYTVSFDNESGVGIPERGCDCES